MTEAFRPRIEALDLCDPVYRDYQRYYLAGMRLAGASVHERPSRLEASALGRMLGLAARAIARFGENPDQHVGRYLVELPDGRVAKCAIDAHDHRDVRSEATRQWADLYFKSNRWPSVQYPDNVLPIVNGNGMATPEVIGRLKAMRERPKDLDFTFISRVWGGREHNVRLFEQAARVPGRKELLAIFTEFDRSQSETSGYQRRLDRAGVPWTYDVVSPDRLWDALSRSRCVLLRAGKHLCIPWRMIDLLCMGACIVYEADPSPQWPEPLTPGEHFVSLGLTRPPNTDAAPDADYEAIPERLGAILADDALQGRLRAGARDYFDAHATPEKVTAYFLNAIAARMRT